jgi:tellurite resistance protein TehA-like permease
MLGSASQKHFSGYNNTSPFLSSNGASIVSASSIVLALMFLGIALFWILFTVYALVEAALRRRLPPGFTMTWWSTIFPIATVNLAFLSLGLALNSQAFALLSVIFVLALLLDYFVCWGFTIYLVFRGELLDGREESQKKE